MGDTSALLAISELGGGMMCCQQGLSAAAWHSPSFPGFEGHMEGRKECRSQACPPSMSCRRASEQRFLQCCFFQYDN